MQFVLSFFITIFLFVSLFAVSVSDVIESFHYRNGKQNLNLAGRAIIKYIEYEEDNKIIINEEDFINEISNTMKPYKILGGVFCYNSSIKTIRKQSTEYDELVVSTEDMEEVNKVNTINNMANYLIDGLKSYEINIAQSNMDDILYKEFFNELAENTVFLVGCTEKNLFVSGFSIDTEGY